MESVISCFVCERVIQNGCLIAARDRDVYLCSAKCAEKHFNSSKVEATPDGIAQHEPGAKLDAGKNRLGLVLGGFSHALQAVGEVGTFGANKYTDNGWKQVDNGQQRYTDAMMRHQLKELAGESLDPDSKLLHAAHGAWNSLARLELIIQEMGANHES